MAQVEKTSCSHSRDVRQPNLYVSFILYLIIIVFNLMDISAEEKSLLHDIKQKQAELDNIFKELEIKKSDVINSEQPHEHDQQRMKIGGNQTYFLKYGEYHRDKIRKDYESAALPFKWLQLPLCKRTVFDKMLFCIPADMIILYTYYLWRKTSGNFTNKWGLKKTSQLYVGLTVFTWALVLGESLLLDPYCDINSHLYNTQLTNIERARLLKKQYQDSKKTVFNIKI